MCCSNSSDWTLAAVHLCSVQHSGALELAQLVKVPVAVDQQVLQVKAKDYPTRSAKELVALRVIVNAHRVHWR